MDRRSLLVAAAAAATLAAGVCAAVLPVSGVAATERSAVVQTASVARQLPAVPQQAGTTTVQTSRPGRPYVLHVPKGLVGPAPLVVALHAHSQGPTKIREYSRLERLADQQGFVVAFPSGDRGSWNAGTCCRPGSEQSTDDVGYLDEVLKSIAGRVVLDPNRLHLVGGSNGGMMALRYACERSEVVASVAVVSATYVADCVPRRAIPVLDLHGDRDGVVPLAGGPNKALRTTFPPVSRSLEPFRKAGGSVEVRVVKGAGHTWFTKAEHGVDATGALWEFLRDHPRLG